MSKTSIVSFDTMAMIWGVKRQAQPGQEFMIGRMERYLHHLAESNTRIGCPSPALAECLVNVTDDNQLSDCMRVILKDFIVWPFDVKAAIIAAELTRNRDLMNQAANAHGPGGRQLVKVDTQIMAISISVGASLLVTGDVKHMQRLAQGRIVVQDIPDIQRQLSLPVDI